MPNGSNFIPALDDNGKPIVEVMTMYRDDDLNQPIEVTFLYGRAEAGDIWGWLARANVGERCRRCLRSRRDLSHDWSTT
jgi:hypothetical protein